MKVCVFGAGAIGGFIAAYLALAGHSVSLVARGANLLALRSRGLTLRHGETDFTVHPVCDSEPDRIGNVDVVFVTVKGPALAAVGDRITPLLGAETPVVFAMNGIPWWYNHGRRSSSAAIPELLDPTGSLKRNVGADRAIGCVVDCPARVPEPGVVICNVAGPGRFTLGEPDGRLDGRVLRLSRSMEEAGLAAPVSDTIRKAVWAKLVVNLSRSPLAVLTGASELQLARQPGISEISRAMIAEAEAVARAHDIRLDLDWPSLLNAAWRVDHRPSMLQDWDAQRPMEIDSIVAIVSRFAAEAGLKSPVIDQILALLTLKARQAGLLYPTQ